MPRVSFVLSCLCILSCRWPSAPSPNCSLDGLSARVLSAASRWAASFASPCARIKSLRVVQAVFNLDRRYERRSMDTLPRDGYRSSALSASPVSTTATGGKTLFIRKRKPWMGEGGAVSSPGQGTEIAHPRGRQGSLTPSGVRGGAFPSPSSLGPGPRKGPQRQNPGPISLFLCVSAFTASAASIQRQHIAFYPTPLDERPQVSPTNGLALPSRVVLADFILVFSLSIFCPVGDFPACFAFGLQSPVPPVRRFKLCFAPEQRPPPGPLFAPTHRGLTVLAFPRRTQEPASVSKRRHLSRAPLTRD